MNLGVSMGDARIDADERARESIATRRPGWCTKHGDFAWLYRDGSIACFWAQIVETSTTDCVWSASECEKLRAALRGLVEAWDEVRDEIHRMSVFAQLHSEPYRGRNISPLFDAARALVGSVPQNESTKETR